MINYQRFPGEESLFEDFKELKVSNYLPQEAIDYIIDNIPLSCRYSVVYDSRIKPSIFVVINHEDMEKHKDKPLYFILSWSLGAGSHRPTPQYTLIINHGNKQLTYRCV